MSKTTKKFCLRGHPRTKDNLVGRSCKLCTLETSRLSDKRRRLSDPLRYLLLQVRRNAKKHGHTFNVTAKDFPNGLPKRCPVLGIEIDYSAQHGHKKNWSKVSFDRTDSSKGYEPGNVVIMSLRGNLLKNDATVPELRRVIRYLLKLEKNKTT